MMLCKIVRRLGLPVLLTCVLPASLVLAQVSPDNDAKGNASAPGRQSTGTMHAYQVAERADSLSQAPAPQLGPAQANEHPLMPALRWAYDGMGNLEKLTDYSATVVKRERVDGKLNDFEHMFVKIRHKPFSVYMYFLAPAKIKGQEVIYIEGANDGLMFAHTVGIKDKMFGTVRIKPDGPVAMIGQRYPLTELGILNLIKRLVEVAQQDVKYRECEVQFFKGAKIKNGPEQFRVCTCIQVVHPLPRRNFLFNVARIFVDDELNIPIRYEAYEWPKEPGGAPELIEEYTYLNLKLNNGFTDADFDTKNPNYHFR
ncbi:MAG: DUF1571 domain-containing protein [Thermoguttaceae bacterium]|jgi:hypothetical protein